MSASLHRHEQGSLFPALVAGEWEKLKSFEEDANRRTQAILINTHGTERELKTLLGSVNALQATITTLQAPSSHLCWD